VRVCIKTSLFFLSLIPNKKPEWTKKSDEIVETKDKQKVDDKKGQTKAFFHSLCHFKYPPFRVVVIERQKHR